MVSVAEAFATLRPDLSKFGPETEEGIKRSLNTISGALLGAGATLTAGVTAPIVGIGAAALKSATSFETAFTGVVKTVDATAAEMDSLRSGILNLSKELPASASSIADVAMSAGQLGIQVPNILEFSRVMIDLGEATNLSAQDAATQLARLANITGMSQQDFERLGSSVVALGNNLATTEAEIVEFALRIAGAGAQVGLSEDQILAWAAALSSVGIDAEAGGTAISRVFIDIANAAANGGSELDQFAQIAGVSTAQFARAFREDASAAVVQFVEGLGRLSDSGANVFGILDDLSLGNIRVRDALLRSSGAGDLLRRSLDLSAEAWEENAALTREAELRYGTTESRLAMLRNQLQVVAITLGDALVPVMLGLVDALSAVVPYIETAARVFAELPGPVQLGAVALAALAAAAGPLLLVVGGMAAGFSALVPVLVAATGALTSFNVALLANPVTAGLVVAGLGAAAIAAKIFGDAMGDANDEMDRSLRISEQTKEQTQEYIFDLQRREQAIREEIAALEASEAQLVSWGGQMVDKRVIIQNLGAELSGVTVELGAQEAALQQHEKQERQSAAAADQMAEAFRNASNDLAQMNPRILATSVAMKLLNDIAERNPLAMFNFVRGIAQVRAALSAQAGIEALVNFIVGPSGSLASSAGAATRATEQLTDAQREAEQATKDHARAAEEAAQAARQLADAALQAWNQQVQATVQGVETLGRQIVTALQRQQQDVLNTALRAIDRERDARMDAHNRRLSQIARERDAAIAAIDEEIAALTQASADDRLADLQRQLALAWDPRERERIEQQITEHQRSEEMRRLQDSRTAIEERARAREQAAQDDLNRQMASLDRQADAARRSYDEITQAWVLEAKARELIAAGEMDTITALIEAHVPEWQSAWQSFGESVINGPLKDIRDEVARINSMVAAVGGAGSGAARGTGSSGNSGNASASQIAALQQLGQRALASGTPQWALENTRKQIRDLGGVPSFAQGGFIPEPTFAVVGDRPGGEHVFGDDQLRRAIREESGAGGGEVHVAARIFIGDREITDIVRVEVDEVARNAMGPDAFGWGVPGRRGG